MDFGTAGAAWIEITYMPTELGNLWVILKNPPPYVNTAYGKDEISDLVKWKFALWL